jgi:hypothetical protein
MGVPESTNGANTEHSTFHKGQDVNPKISNHKGKDRYIKGGTQFSIPDCPD